LSKKLNFLSKIGLEGSCEIIAGLRSIPLWPACELPICVSAENALFTVDSHLIVPWMKEACRFIKPCLGSASAYQRCLRALNVTNQSEVVLFRDYILPLPETLSQSDWNRYLLLVKAASRYCQQGSLGDLKSLLRKEKFAADSDGNFRVVGELFDHREQVFASALRGQASKFLHGEIRELRSFWLSTGLRCREDGLVTPEDYCICLEAMAHRLAVGDLDSGSDLQSDCETVLSLLISPNSSIGRFGDNHWSRISREKVFLAKTEFHSEPQYRQTPMGSVVATQRLLALSEVISYDYAGVCWSQTSFALHIPTKEAFAKVPGNGEPPVGMVWCHLEHLKRASEHLSNNQVQNFLRDLYGTYTFLQDHLGESVAYLCPEARASAFWLNLDIVNEDIVSVEDIQSSWSVLEMLVLSSSCDAGRVKSVRTSLMRYEKLLRALGCESMHYPSITPLLVGPGYSLSTSLRSLRGRNELLDVTFSAEGKQIRAHQVVLAAASEKWAAQFSGRFTVEDVINCDDLSYHTLSAMIDYAYEDKVDWTGMMISEGDDAKTKADKIHLLLDLHEGARYCLMQNLKTDVENVILGADRVLLDLENIMSFQQRAKEVGADKVQEICDRFIKTNLRMVMNAHPEFDFEGWL
jgi:sacsin